MNTRKLSFGFTLIELMVTVSILVILLTVAIPSFLSTIQNNRSVTITNDFIGALNLARSEAIKRGVSVSICATKDDSFNSCGNNWANGWIVFVNPNEDGVFANDTTEVLLRIQHITGEGTTITTNPNSSIATYTSNGYAAAGTGNLIFTLKMNGCTANNGKTVTISVTGRTSVNSFTCS